MAARGFIAATNFAGAMVEGKSLKEAAMGAVGDIAAMVPGGGKLGGQLTKGIVKFIP